MKREWTNISADIVPISKRQEVGKDFDSLEFRKVEQGKPVSMSAAAGLALTSLHGQGVIRGVVAVAESPCLAPLGLYAVESKFGETTQRVYFADDGCGIIPLAIDTV